MKKIKKWLIIGVLCAGVFLVSIQIIPGVVSEFVLIFAGGEEEEYKKSNNSNNSTLNSLLLSPEVEQYRRLVEVEAKKHKKLEYVNLFLAIMQQESGGFGNDVFQCSESKGLPPGTLTLQESIQQGVAYASGMLDRAKVSLPTDIETIRLALQGYNMSGGYIDYAIKIDGKWTQENVFAYAKDKSGGKKNTGSRKQQLGPWKYGDQYYTDHVLRYYDTGENIVPEGESAKIALENRMAWLFPKGEPKSASEMQNYLTQIKVGIINSKGKADTMTLTVHKKLATEIKAVFADLKKAKFKVLPEETAGYCWRMMASNSSKVSHHSYGCVIDLNWTHNGASYTSWGYNPGKDEYSVTKDIVDIWKKHGFYWGGDWSKEYNDPMHFTYTNH